MTCNDVIPVNPDPVDYDPIPAEALDASGWYKTEQTTYTFQNIHGNTDLRAWYITQGYIEDAPPLVGIETTNIDGTDIEYTATTYSFTRRVFDPEPALKALIEETTAAYNDGRLLNDSRYDDILLIYQNQLTNAESTMQERAGKDCLYESLVEILIASFYSEYDLHTAAVDTIIGTGLEQNRKDEINLNFDNQVAAVAQNLINRGLYNTASLDAMTTGIEKKREYALNDLADKVQGVELNQQNTLYQQRDNITKSVLDARDRLQKMRAAGQLDRLGMQVRITDIIGRFMERRTDEYPSLDAITEAAARFGAANSNEVQP